MKLTIPELSLVVLVGASGSGKSIRDIQPHIIHICCTLKEHPMSGAIYLDFARRETGYSLESVSESSSGSGSEALSPSHLSRLLSVTKKNHLPPLLILDVLRPSGLTEAARQLFLRNSYAADFFYLEKVWGVVGMGLAEREEQDTLYDKLINGLVCQAAAGEVVNDLRQAYIKRPSSDETRFESSMASLGIALYAYDPALPLVVKSLQ